MIHQRIMNEKDQIRMNQRIKNDSLKNHERNSPKNQVRIQRVKNDSPMDHERNSLKDQRIKLKNQEAKIHIQEKSKPKFASKKAVPKRKRRKER